LPLPSASAWARLWTCERWRAWTTSSSGNSIEDLGHHTGRLPALARKTRRADHFDFELDSCFSSRHRERGRKWTSRLATGSQARSPSYSHGCGVSPCQPGTDRGRTRSRAFGASLGRFEDRGEAMEAPLPQPLSPENGVRGEQIKFTVKPSRAEDPDRLVPANESNPCR